MIFGFWEEYCRWLVVRGDRARFDASVSRMPTKSLWPFRSPLAAGFPNARGQQSRWFIRLRRPQEPEQPDKPTCLRLPHRPTADADQPVPPGWAAAPCVTIDTEPGTRSQMGCDLLLLLGPLPPATRPAATEKMTRHHAAFHGGVAPWFGTSPRLRAGRIRRGGRRSSPWSTPPRNRGRTSPRRRCRHRLRRGRAVAS